MDADSSAVLEASLRLLANTKIPTSASAAAAAASAAGRAQHSDDCGVVAVVKTDDLRECRECRECLESSDPVSPSEDPATAWVAEATTRLLVRAMASPEVAINPARFAAYFESCADRLLCDYAAEVRALVGGGGVHQATHTEIKPKRD